MDKKKYDDILTSNSFAIVIRCKHCHSIDCFIGIKDRCNAFGMDHNSVVDIDIICGNCGHVENCY